MAWVFLAASILGVITGFFFRVGAVILLSGAIVVAALVCAVADGWTFAEAAVRIVGLVITVQLGYLAGLWLSSLCPTPCWSGETSRNNGGTAIS